MSDGMEEIIDDFLTEAEESLEKIDPLFIELEEKGYDSELLNGIFRSVHTIKGAAGFLGFQDIVDVSHKTESLLKKLRDGDMSVSSGLITIILKSVDMLKALLVSIKTSGERPPGVETLLSDLDGALVTSPGGDAAPTTESHTPLQDPATMQEEADNFFNEAIQEAHAEQAALATLEESLEAEEIAEDQPQEETSVAQTVSEAIDSVLAIDDDHFDEDAHLKYSAKETDMSQAPGIPETPPMPVTQAQAETKAPQKPEAKQPEKQKDTAQAQTQPVKSVMQTLRVDVARIDKVMNLTGEIVLVRNRLLNIAGYLDQKYAGDDHVDGLQESVSFLDLVTADLQLGVMKMRMQPIKKVFGKFPRLVRDISQNLGKDVHLSISGEDTEVDRTVIERIGDPLVHIIRNAIDHGIESIEQRQQKGKPAKGLVEISAYQQGSQIVIEVSDDGRGIDVEAIRRNAVSKGFATEDEAMRMTDKEAINLIFNAGFSTMEVASELSGRGVGMDVVKTNISKLNGYVDVMTTKDEGSTVRISIPLTLAIIQALMVRAGGMQYAIPLGVIEETIKITQDDIDNVTGRPVLKIRDHVYTLAELTDVLNIPAPEEELKSRYVLVIAVGDRHFCIAVDEFLGQEEVVIKAIDGIDTDTTGVLGATITGEGKIVLILDPSGMSRVVAGLTNTSK